MNPYVVSSCLRASLRFSYATHVFAYAADSEHVELARRLRVGVWSVSAQELLTRAPFLMQPPELLKMMYPEEEDDEELPSSSFSGLALCSYCKSRNGLCGSDIHLEGKRAAELSELTRTLRACLRKLTRPSPFSFPKSVVSEAFVVLGCNST